MSKPKAPSQPNFQQAAHENITTPYGSLKWEDEGGQKFFGNVSLAPQAQQTLDAQMGLSKGLAQTAQGQLPQIQDFYSGPMDVQSLSQPAYQAITSRLDPRFQREEEQLRTRLANQGLSAGGEAYNNEMNLFGQAKNDAYNQAQLSSLQNASQFYNQPLNTFNALRTGAQVQNPNFAGIGGQGLGAAQAQGNYGMGQYGADVSSYNAMMEGLFGLAGAGVYKYSDRRLKSNIEHIGTHPLGIGVYEYDIFGRRERGVMADELEMVKPEAVILGLDGYKMVRYDLIADCSGAELVADDPASRLRTGDSLNEF